MLVLLQITQGVAVSTVISLQIIHKGSLMKKLNFLFQVLFLMLLLSACSQPSTHGSTKTPQLTEEKRREMDVLLANELDTWNENSVRCEFDRNNPHAPAECREAFFHELANQGYEMADIASKLFKPTKGITVNDHIAFVRLRQLAKQGDKSALCFVQQILQFHRDNNESFSDAVEYTKLGKTLVLPLCAQNEFYLYWNGAYGYPKDLVLAHQRLLEAASAGLYHAQTKLLADYRQEGFGDTHTIRKALCWGRLAQNHSSWAFFQDYVNDLMVAARDKNDQSKIIHPELEQLAKEWDLRTTPYISKPTTSNDCMQIEGKVLRH
jgi:hypothetical protein